MKKKTSILSYFFLGMILFFLLFPIYWMFVTSFKTNMQLYKIPPSWLPLSPTLGNYIELIKGKVFLTYYSNNFIVAFSASVMTTVVALLAGYSFSRFKVKGSNLILFGLLSTQMFPVIGRVIALYTVFKSMRLLNTRIGLAFALTAATLPFCTWLIKGFFDDIPKSIEEAANIDGCGRLMTLLRIIMPLTKSGLLAIGLYTFLLAWDDFLHCVTLITSDNLRTLSAGISMRYLGELSYDWALINTISVIGTVPMLLLFVFFQKYMVQGLTAGAVKA